MKPTNYLQFFSTWDIMHNSEMKNKQKKCLEVCLFQADLISEEDRSRSGLTHYNKIWPHPSLLYRLVKQVKTIMG